MVQPQGGAGQWLLHPSAHIAIMFAAIRSGAAAAVRAAAGTRTLQTSAPAMGILKGLE